MYYFGNVQAEKFTEDFRPVQLKQYIKTGDQLLEVRDSRHSMQENLLEYSRAIPAPTPTSRKNDPDGLSVLVAEIAPQHCCLVFCSTKKNCESVAKLISSNLSSKLFEVRTAEKLKLRKALEVV